MHIYLDHNATTQPDPAVFDAMLPVIREKFGNPSTVPLWPRTISCYPDPLYETITE